MNLKIKLLIIFILLLGSWITFELTCNAPNEEEISLYQTKQARVEGDGLISEGFPKSTITFDEGIEYIDNESFILYGIASCDIYLFGELTGDGQYKRLYWIQYEGYLPKRLLPFMMRIKPGPFTYDYSSDPFRVEIGGATFYTSTSYHDIERSEEYLNAENEPKDSDFAHVARLLKRNGVNINAEVLGVRMVHLNSTNEKELMIIYYEVMDGDELNFAKLDTAGEDSKLWEEVSKGLRDRASSGVRISFTEE